MNEITKKLLIGAASLLLMCSNAKAQICAGKCNCVVTNKNLKSDPTTTKLGLVNHSPIIWGTQSPDNYFLEFYVVSPNNLTIEVDSLNILVVNPNGRGTNTTYSLFDNGINADKIKGDNVFTSSKSFTGFEKVDNIDKLNFVDGWGEITVFYRDNSGAQEALFESKVVNVLLDPKILDQVEKTAIHKLPESGINFTKEIINVYNDDNTIPAPDYVISTVGQDTIWGRVRELLNSVWCNEYTEDFIYADLMFEAVVSAPENAVAWIETGTNKNPHIYFYASDNDATLAHEVNHIFNSKFNNSFRNRGHWWHFTRPTSGFGLGDYSGVLSEYIDTLDHVYTVIDRANENIGVFNDLELATMGIIDYDDISFPLVSFDLNRDANLNDFAVDQSTSETCEEIGLDPSKNSCRKYLKSELERNNAKLYAYSKEDIEPYFLNNKSSLADHWDNSQNDYKIKYIVATERPLDDESLWVLSAYARNKLAVLQEANPLVSFDQKGNTIPECAEGIISDVDLDGFYSDVDCNDSNSNINPQAEEIANNQVDENCDGNLENTTKVHELSNVILEIYPNPTYHTLNIIGAHDFLVELYTLTGVKKFSEVGANKIDVSSYMSGTYILKIESESDNSYISDKIVIAK